MDFISKITKDRDFFKVEKTIGFERDTEMCSMNIIPTVNVQPPIYGYSDDLPIVDINWLNCHIYIGTWRSKYYEK